MLLFSHCFWFFATTWTVAYQAPVSTVSQSLLKFISILLVCCCFVVAKSCRTHCNPMDRSTPGFPVPHYLPEFAQVHDHWISDAIQPSHPLLCSSPSAFNLSQHQGLFQWVSYLHQVGDGKLLQYTCHENLMNWIKRPKGTAPKDKPPGWKVSSILLRKSEGQLTRIISPKLSCRKASLYIRVQTKSIIWRGPFCDFALDRKVI